MKRPFMSTLLVITLVAQMVVLMPASAADHRVVPRGTILKLVLDDSLDSEDAVVGNKFSATLAEEVIVDGSLMIRKGSSLTGTVTQVEDADRLAGLTGRASMTLRFDQITTNGRSWPISATLVSVHDAIEGVTDEDVDIDEEGQVEAETDIGDIIEKGVIGIGAGALLGALFGNVSRGLILGSIGSAIAILAPEGEEVELREGTGLRIRLDRDLNLSIT